MDKDETEKWFVSVLPVHCLCRMLRKYLLAIKGIPIFSTSFFSLNTGSVHHLVSQPLHKLQDSALCIQRLHL